MNQFLKTIWGQSIIVLLIMAIFAIILIMDKRKEVNKVSVLTKTALIVALAFALNQITLFRMPQGGSITPLSMLVLYSCSYFFGVRYGIMGGVVFGILDLMVHPFVVSPIQLFLDYPLAFGSIGLGGTLRHFKYGLPFGYALGVLSRFLCNVASGVLFFGMYAPEGFNALLWAVVYNGSFLGVELILGLVVVNIPVVKKFMKKEKEKMISPLIS